MYRHVTEMSCELLAINKIQGLSVNNCRKKLLNGTRANLITEMRFFLH